MLLGLQQVHGQGGHQRTGQDVRRDHGKDDCFRERDKEELGYPTEKEHGEKYDTDAHGRDQGRDCNLGGSLENPFVELRPLLQVTLDIFDSHRSVIDQDTDGEGEAAQRHDVDGLAQKTEDDHRTQDGQRNRDGDNDCAAPAAKKDQDHQARERCGDDGFTDDSINRSSNEDRLIREGLNLKIRWKGLGYMREEVADTVDHVDCRGVPGLQYRYQHTTIPVLTDDVRLRRESVADGCHITKVDHRVSHRFDRQIVQLLHGSRIRIQVDV